MLKRCKTFLFLAAGITLMTALVYAADDAGKAVYDKKCGSCHGKDGKGNAGMAKAFKVDASALNLIAASDEKKNKEWPKIVTDGKGKMPAYGKQLKANELSAVLAYAQGLSKKK